MIYFDALYSDIGVQHAAVIFLLALISTILIGSFYFIRHFALLYSKERTLRLQDRDISDHRLEEKNKAILRIIDEYRDTTISATQALTSIAGLMTSIRNGGGNDQTYSQ